ncbi:hypothetical protein Tsubulata_044247 [Turnera subulata]|uniref:RRM domain-containing protein n=1 Tax=Turnera subulata TaxID=218843 RepID=A0A9Q0F2Z4_9ROSI|nr:hypothetical protein Tsubulata_044247 [Turnera subulata]
MSPGLPGGPLAVNRPQTTISNADFTSNTNPNSHPYLYDFQHRNQKPPKTLNPSAPQSKPITNHFSKWSQVLDVFIPRKPSRSGKRFAFVRFRNNVDIPSLLNSINSMHVDDVKIFANVAKARHEAKGNTMERGKFFNRPRDGNDMRSPAVDNRSFVDAVREHHKHHNPGRSSNLKVKSVDQPSTKSYSTFLAKDGTPTWLECCALGVMKKPMPIKSLLDVFPANESMVLKVIPLGGVSFLFRFQSAVDMNELIGNKPVWFDQLLETSRPARDGDAAFNRLCWILVKGTPPGSWSENFFRILVSSFGYMVDWSSESRSLERMDVVEILILTSSNSFMS